MVRKLICAILDHKHENVGDVHYCGRCGETLVSPDEPPSSVRAKIHYIGEVMAARYPITVTGPRSRTLKIKLKRGRGDGRD